MPVSHLRVGNIVDAQDYLGTWHLAIVIDEDEAGLTKTMHFLPFVKANRDEQFTADDSTRVAAAFSKQDASGEPSQQI